MNQTKWNWPLQPHYLLLNISNSLVVYFPEWMSWQYTKHSLRTVWKYKQTYHSCIRIMSNKYDSAYREIVYARKIFLKTISAYQGVRNVSFSEDFVNVLNEWSHTVKLLNWACWKLLLFCSFSDALLNIGTNANFDIWSVAFWINSSWISNKFDVLTKNGNYKNKWSSCQTNGQCR